MSLRGRLAVGAVGAGVAIVVWSWFIYTATFEWRQSSIQLAERRAGVVAQLLLEAIVGDMRGAQRNVLSAPAWDRFDEDQPHEIVTVVASSFARYPYPESFFVWQRDMAAAGLLFFHRSDRTPPWRYADESEALFPVVLDEHAAPREVLLERILQSGREGRRYSAFTTSMGGDDYQVVAEITYLDEFREEIVRVVGFTVNLQWVRDSYFPDLTMQATEIAAEDGSELSVAVFDSSQRPIVGSEETFDGPFTTRYEFPLAFVDPLTVVAGATSLLSPQPWTVAVSAAGDPALLRATQGAERALLLGVSAAVALIIGLVLAFRAERTRAQLAELKADFATSVTHELKTPIASIRAAGETLNLCRFNDHASVADYSGIVVTEASRLSRLVENLLVHVRFSDITDFYTFKAVDLAVLFEEIVKEFRVQLADFVVDIDIPSDLPYAWGDELSLRLLFDNLIDNAIKYSGSSKWIGIAASVESNMVQVGISDRGIGLAADEVPPVTPTVGPSTHPRAGGLGLAIVDRIVRDHGGTRSVLRHVGGGTTVSVSLQVA